jgi:oxalate decarboxylase/phosphoglucose isomerase-like protein (cupin superfamily)
VLGEEKPLGQHFHELKAETFVCIAGEGGTVWVARAERIDEGRGRIIGQVTQIEFVPGTVVYVPPYCTHCFRLKKGTKMICFSSEPFNEINKDMVFCPIEV